MLYHEMIAKQISSFQGKHPQPMLAGGRSHAGWAQLCRARDQDPETVVLAALACIGFWCLAIMLVH